MRASRILLAIACLPFGLLAAETLRFEAEDCVVNREAFKKDTFANNIWTLWTTDPNAQNWSGRQVIKSPDVKEDRETPEDGAPPLHLLLKGIPDGTYNVRVGKARQLAVSEDGKTWRRLGSNTVHPRLKITGGTFELWIDDRYAEENPKHRGTSYIDYVELAPLANLVKGVWNGDFEAVAGDKPKGWRLPAKSATMDARVVHDDVHGGRSALRFTVTAKTGTRWDVICASGIPTQPGQKLRVSAWTKGVAEQSVSLRVDGYKGGKLVRRFVGRSLIDSGPEWARMDGYFTVPDDVNELRLSILAHGPADLRMDDVSLVPDTPLSIKGTMVRGWATKRPTERLNRGVVALRTPRGAYISWRLLATDPAKVAFDVLRNGTKVNAKPIQQTCDFLDPAAPAEGKVVYRIVPTGNAKPAGTATLAAMVTGTPYLRIPMQEADLRSSRVGVGDLDGDGAYDFVVRHPRASIDPGTGYWRRSETTYKLDAYTSTGTFLWRRELGWSIETGIWFAPFVVCDVDGDGRAEVIAKTGEGDPRNPAGKVVSGPEWLTVIDGRTGKDLCRTPWPAREGMSSHNMAARNQLAVAYLDGKTPCLIALRGTYGRMKVDAHQMKDGKLLPLWRYDNARYPTEYWGQGAHTTRVADVDGDGRDEILLGSVCLDDDGTPLWTTGRGHPDGAHLGDILLDRPGLEVFYCMETRQRVDGGLSMVDAATGAFIWKLGIPTTHVHSGGMCADMDPLSPGRECYGADTDAKKRSNRGWFYSADGRVLQTGVGYAATQPTIFWDGDLQREIFRGRVMDHGGGPLEDRMARGLVADIIGDWREEVIASQPGELRIYSTTIPAMDRRTCLMQDHTYRACVRMASMGYVVSPTLSRPPAATAHSVNLTKIDTDDGPACQIVISATPGEALQGTLQLSPDQGITLAKSTLTVDLKAGATQVWNVPIVPAENRAAKGRIVGELRTARQTLRTEAWVQTTAKPTATGALVEAETIAAQGGGEVHIRTDKTNVRGTCISHWDKKGHFLEYQVEVPANGRFYLLVRYCTPHEGKRQLQLDGKDIAEIALPMTGGFGDGATDWEEITFADPNGKPFTLKKGRHTIRLTNTNDTGINLDYLGFVRR